MLTNLSSLNLLFMQIIASATEASFVQQFVSFIKPLLEARLIPPALGVVHDRWLQAINGVCNAVFVYALAGMTGHLTGDWQTIVGLAVLAIAQAKASDAFYQNSKSGLSVGGNGYTTVSAGEPIGGRVTLVLNGTPVPVPVPAEAPQPSPTAGS